MRLPEHMRGCKILKMDAVSWLQASNESLTMWQPPSCLFCSAQLHVLGWFKAEDLASPPLKSCQK